MEKIILIRHGETDINKADKTHLTDDVESLNDKGIGQIEKTAERMKEFSPTKVYTSRETRAVQSGEIISNILETPLESIDGMQERNWGDLSGKPWPEIQNILEPMSLEDRYIYTPPNGESWQSFETRLIKTLSGLLEKHPNEAIVIVSHGGAIRALMPYLLGIGKEESLKHNPDNASITVFDHDEQVFSQQLANDTSHLK